MLPIDPETLRNFGLGVLGTLGFYAWYEATRLPRPKTQETDTAHWGELRDLKRAKLLGSTGLQLGLLGRRRIRIRMDSHLLTLAPTRAGKGVSAIIPNLLTYPGSVFVIDPKGENAMITARQRAKLGQRVHVLDPWELTGLPSAAFNPFDWLQADSPDLIDDASLLADALVMSQGGDPKESHWENEAKALLAGLILYVACIETPQRRNLLRVRDLLTTGPEAFDALLDVMSECTEANGLIARAAFRLRQKAERERSGVVSTAQVHTHFLDSPRMSRVLARSSFRLDSLKRGKASVFLVLPSERIATFNRWLRLMVSLGLVMMARVPGKQKQPVLFLLDEFAALGRLETVETAMGLMAGYGLQLWPILQDLSQLRALYSERWETFLANAGMVQAFNVSEPGTAEYLSGWLGRRTANVGQVSGSRNEISTRATLSRSVSWSTVARPLLMPEEIMRLPADRQLILLRGLPPFLMTKLPYYRDRKLKALASPMPTLRESFNREAGHARRKPS